MLLCEKGKRFGSEFRLKICKRYIVSSTVLKISSSFPVPPSSAAFPLRLSVTKTPDKDSESCANMEDTWEDSDSEASHRLHAQQLPKINMKHHMMKKMLKNFPQKKKKEIVFAATVHSDNKRDRTGCLFFCFFVQNIDVIFI